MFRLYSYSAIVKLYFKSEMRVRVGVRNSFHTLGAVLGARAGAGTFRDLSFGWKCGCRKELRMCVGVGAGAVKFQNKHFGVWYVYE